LKTSRGAERSIAPWSNRGRSNRTIGGKRVGFDKIEALLRASCMSPERVLGFGINDMHQIKESKARPPNPIRRDGLSGNKKPGARPGFVRLGERK
jgi:hypothetical protein